MDAFQRSTELVNKWTSIYGERRTKDFIEAFSSGKKPTLRVNTLRASPSKLVTKLEAKGFVLENSLPGTGYYIVDQPFNPGLTTEYLDGQYFLQNTSSQLATVVLEPRPEQLVADTCSAPGGKTTHIAQLMNNTGTILAVERSRQRLLPLKNNLQRCGVSNCTGVHGDARKLHGLEMLFDRIMIDAPCTGTGTLGKNPDKLKTYRTQDSRILAGIQSSLLESAFKSLKQGGRLVYCTCSLEPEENEMVIHGFIQEQGRKARILDAQSRMNIKNMVTPLAKYKETVFDSNIAGCARILPTNIHEGFFIALIERVI